MTGACVSACVGEQEGEECVFYVCVHVLQACVCTLTALSRPIERMLHVSVLLTMRVCCMVSQTIVCLCCVAGMRVRSLERSQDPSATPTAVTVNLEAPQSACVFVYVLVCVRACACVHVCLCACVRACMYV